MLGINADPVTIKGIENAIIERAFDEGWIVPRPPAHRTRQAHRRRRIRARWAGRRRSAEQGRTPGHRVRARRSHRRAAALRHPRVQDGEARPRSPAGDHGGGRREVPARTPTSAATFRADELRREFDAIVLAGGSTIPRDLPIPGRQLTGVHFAMEYLTQQNRRNQGDAVPDAERHHRHRQARRHHRRRRHRRRLPGHHASAGRRVGAPVRAAAQAARRARRRQPVAAVAADLPRLDRARGRRRARCTRCSRPNSTDATDASSACKGHSVMPARRTAG